MLYKHTGNLEKVVSVASLGLKPDFSGTLIYIHIYILYTHILCICVYTYL